MELIDTTIQKTTEAIISQLTTIQASKEKHTNAQIELLEQQLSLITNHIKASTVSSPAATYQPHYENEGSGSVQNAVSKSKPRTH